jgi:hypothetical protein
LGNGHRPREFSTGGGGLAPSRSVCRGDGDVDRDGEPVTADGEADADPAEGAGVEDFHAVPAALPLLDSPNSEVTFTPAKTRTSTSPASTHARGRRSSRSTVRRRAAFGR